ncbi:MAG: carboxypeptidase-like regulatory domain-containing protein [Tenuifilaceae bacterium]
MKYLYFISIFIGFTFKGFCFEKDTIISCHYNKVPFSIFAEKIHTETGVKIFYKEEWTKSIDVTINADSITIIDAVQSTLKGTSLVASKWYNNIVILKNEKLLTNLPEYESSNKSELVKNIEVIEAKEIKSKNSRNGQIKTYRIGNYGSSTVNSKVRINGKISDEESGELLVGATIYLKDIATGSATNNYGNFSLFLAPGRYNAEIESLGYEKNSIQMEVFSDGEIELNLKKTLIPIEEVQIIGSSKMSIVTREPGMERVAMRSIRELPMFMGERDVIKISELLPGIVSTGEGSAGINVRGGNSDQNLFYINNIPIYNTSHVFGFFPAFNPDIIKDFSIYKGHIPAQYGGRLSSIFNIQTKQGNRKRFNMHAGINPITGFLTAEGPIKKDTSSFLISCRSNYSNWILGRIQDTLINQSSSKFYDISGLANYDFNYKNKLKVFFYRSSDNFKLSSINSYWYSNTGASVEFEKMHNSIFTSKFTQVFSNYSFSTENNQDINTAYKQSYSINHIETKYGFTLFLSNKHSIEGGASSITYLLDRGDINPLNQLSLAKPTSLGKEKALENSIYISNNLTLLKWLDISAGLRLSTFTPLGSRNVYKYYEGLPVEVNNIRDTLKFGNNKPIKWYNSPEIRFSATIKTNISSSFKFSYNRMQQNLFMLSNTISIAPNTQWKLADYYLKPSKSDQFSLGFYKVFPSIGFESSVEVYTKNTSHYSEFKDGADFITTAQTETMILQGDQKSYGAEFLIKKNGRKLNGWISYTYSRSIIQVKGDNYWNSINRNLSYPSNFDIPHILNVVLNYQISRRLIFSATSVYQKGKPITFPESVYYFENVPVISYSKRNEYRIPDYFRVDLSLTLEGDLKRKKFMHSSWIFNVYNLTGRDNPYSVFFRVENKQIRGYKYSVISIPLITLTWLIKLGNYASN